MIIYYVMHPFCRGRLRKYLNLNNTNFYPSSPRKKSGFVKVRVRVMVIDAMLLSIDLP